ncbi:hypothetical protein EMIT0P228_70178 [Pseudomonas brassicacearum]
MEVGEFWGLPDSSFSFTVKTYVITVRAISWLPSTSVSTTTSRRVHTASWKSSALPLLS